MRNIILIISLMCISLLSAATLERFQDTGIGVNARFENLRSSPFERSEISIDEGEDQFPDTPMISRTLALPFETAELSINQMTWRVFNKDGEYLNTRAEVNESALDLSLPFTFREMQRQRSSLWTIWILICKVVAASSFHRACHQRL